MRFLRSLYLRTRKHKIMVNNEKNTFRIYRLLIFSVLQLCLIWMMN